MKVIKNVTDMHKMAEKLRREGQKIGFVPTMGFLHEGHLSLIDQIRYRCDQLVVSIFVNPTQFAPHEDFDRYPRDFQRDEQLCREAQVDLIFYPQAGELYPEDFKTYVMTEDLSSRLCGVTRPTHFRGVTTIVAKLFNIVKPHCAIFGQKDAQQFLILKRMVADLNFDIELMMGPIIRESDGLAMSSRNKYLTDDQRRQATVLYRSLQKARQMINNGIRNADKIHTEMLQILNTAPAAKLDYLSIVDPYTLDNIKLLKEDYLIALAVYFENTRLIDNILKLN